MLYDQNRSNFGDITSAAAKDYCVAYGYRFACYREVLDQNQSPHWSKLLALQQEFEKGEDWLLWLDADALIVQQRFRLEDILGAAENSGKNLIFSQDANGICSGVFFIKNTEWSKQFIKSVLLLGELPDCGHLHEQQTIRKLFENFPSLRDHVTTIPDSIIQNPESEFSSTAFIMHYWAGTKPFELYNEKIRNITFHGWQKAYF